MQDLAEPSQEWSEVPRLIRSGKPLSEPWESLFGPLRSKPSGRPMAVGQIGQSLDGRIATLSGHSRYINGPEGIAHLHRLRALVDAVVVGAGTVRADDPQLTVREVSGPNPVRVVIDPNGTLPAGSRVFIRDGVRFISTQSDASLLLAGATRIADGLREIADNASSEANT